MEKLPVEIVEKILSNKILSIQDVVNFSSICKYFRHAVLGSSLIWKHKFLDNWPKFMNLLDKHNVDYLGEIQYLYALKKRAMSILETMPSRFYKKYQLSDVDFEEWDTLIQEKDQTFYYLASILLGIIRVNECIKSINVVPLNTAGNKTLQYYACKVLRYIKQLHLSQVWRNYRELPPKEQILEKGATFVAQWCQTDNDVSDDYIEQQLDLISEKVRNRLFEINSNHGLFKAPREDLEKWKKENLTKSQWSIPECRQLIAVMREILYGELGFCGNNLNYYMPDNSLINKVLETRTGLPIILAVIYASVGRRLGLFFEPINFPAHFLLRFTEGEGRNYNEYYIDTFNGGDIMQKTACPYSRHVSRGVLFPIASSVEVVGRIVNNLELSTRQYIEPNGRVTFLRAILELMILVNPQDLSAIVNLAKLYTLHQVNTKNLEAYLLTQTYHAEEQVENVFATIRGFSRHHVDTDLILTEDEPTVRTGDLKYAVGMVMTDITHNDKCVIYGWNPGCSAGGECPASVNWPNHTMIGRPKQPFYNVLVEDGSYRYVPQDVLIPSTEIGNLYSNRDLGRHFSHFFVNHFVPNAEKEKEYPYDTKVRHKFYHEAELRNYEP